MQNSIHDASYHTFSYFLLPILNSEALLVKPEIAQEQLRREEEARLAEERQRKIAEGLATYDEGQKQTDIPPVGHASTSSGATTTTGSRPPYQQPAPSPTDAKPGARHFHGSVNIRPLMMSIDAGTIMDEVVTHLAQLDQLGVRVTIEIQADINKGIPDDIVRDLLENCRNLKFHSYGFEEE